MAGVDSNGREEIWWALYISTPAEGLTLVQWLEKDNHDRYYPMGDQEGIDSYLTGQRAMQLFAADNDGKQYWSGPTQKELEEAAAHASVASQATQEDHGTIQKGQHIIFVEWDTKVKSYQYRVGTVLASTKDVITTWSAIAKQPKKLGWERLVAGWSSLPGEEYMIEVPVHRVLPTPCSTGSGGNDRNFKLDANDAAKAVDAATKAGQLPANLKR